MEQKSVYELCLELSHASGRSIDNASWLRMARAENAIRRVILVPGSTRLRDLHPLIQKAFGWNNLHLHKFALERQDYDLLTGGEPGICSRLCGVLFRDPSESSFAWCRHILFDAPMYGLEPVRPEYPVEDSFFLNQSRASLMGRAPRHTQKPAGHENARGRSGHNANTLLERLRLSQLLVPAGSRRSYVHDRPGLASWREELFVSMSDSMSRVVSFSSADPLGYSEACSAIDELESWKSSFLCLMKIRSNPAACLSRFGMNAAEAFEHHRGMLLECCENAGRLVTEFDPDVMPYFSSLRYWYDSGDQWCVHIKCSNVFHAGYAAAAPGFLTQVLRDCPRPDAAKAGAAARLYSASGSGPDLALPACGGSPWLDHNNIPAAPDSARTLDMVSGKSCPVCIAADGLNVLDDIGGIEGYFDFLKTINGSDRSEAGRVRELASLYGWSGKKPRPEEVL